MTPEEQRIAIAEILGWTWDGSYWVSPDVYKTPTQFSDLPNYPFDLNAIHEAEKVLIGNLIEFEPSDKWTNYCYWLSHITKMGFDYHAAASQRAEAFLRVFNKWKD